MSVEATVKKRYAEGAQQKQEALCCPVDYDSSLLKLLPPEIVEKDYGCGDPSRYVRSGDVVLDLGSGGGKICYMAAQIVGESGQVIGVDMTDDMLALARKYQSEMVGVLGSDRVDFRKGYIQDLALNLERMEERLAAHPVETLAGWQDFQHWQQEQRVADPLIADSSVDIVISNCVLNLVDSADRNQLISEIYRVLKPGGRVAISDIVSDESVPDHLRTDPHLWSGCISGAFQEQEFLDQFHAAGFVAVAYDKWDSEPWQVVEGIEFRSVTLTAEKPGLESMIDCGQAVLYKGPFAQVQADDGRTYPRGQRTAVSESSYKLLTEGTYGKHFVGINPELPATSSRPFEACDGEPRPARETRGGMQKGGSSSCC